MTADTIDLLVGAVSIFSAGVALGYKLCPTNATITTQRKECHKLYNPNAKRQSTKVNVLYANAKPKSVSCKYASQKTCTLDSTPCHLL